MFTFRISPIAHPKHKVVLSRKWPSYLKILSILLPISLENEPLCHIFVRVEDRAVIAPVYF